MLKIWVPEFSNQSHELVDFVSTMLIDAGAEPRPDEERPPLWLASLRSSPQEVSSIMQVLVALMRSEAVATVARASASLALARFAEYCVSAGAVGCSELGLIELLVAARAIETWCEQCGSPDYPLELRLEAARALGNLAAICDAGTAVLIEKGAVAALVRLMVSQMPAAASAIAAVGCAADADAMMIDDDDNELASAADAVVARGRSATSDTADDIRVDPACAFPVRCVCSSLQALTNLREDRSMLVALTTDACLHALLTASSFTESSFISAVPSHVAPCRAAGVASWLLCLLCTEPDTAPYAIRFPGTVSAVLRHASAVSSEAQEEAAWALAAISADAEHAALLVRSPGTLPVLLELLVRPQAAVRLQSAWALANLALDPLAKRLLSERPGVVASFMCAVRMSISMSGSSTSGARAEGEGRMRQNSEEAVDVDGAHEVYDQELQQVPFTPPPPLLHSPHRPLSSGPRPRSTISRDLPRCPGCPAFCTRTLSHVPSRPFLPRPCSPTPHPTAGAALPGHPAHRPRGALSVQRPLGRRAGHRLARSPRGALRPRIACSSGCWGSGDACSCACMRRPSLGRRCAAALLLRACAVGEDARGAFHRAAGQAAQDRLEVHPSSGDGGCRRRCARA